MLSYNVSENNEYTVTRIELIINTIKTILDQNNFQYSNNIYKHIKLTVMMWVLFMGNFQHNVSNISSRNNIQHNEKYVMIPIHNIIDKHMMLYTLQNNEKNIMI